MSTLTPSFMLEDAATILAAMDLPTDRATIAAALVALYCAIVLSDFGLYGIGLLAASTPWAPIARTARGRDWVQCHVIKLVFISRFTPGARLPAYTACGYFRADLRRFALASITASVIWTTLLVGGGLRLCSVIATHLGVWGWAGMVAIVTAVMLAGRLASYTRAAWELAHPNGAARQPPGPRRTIYTSRPSPDGIPPVP